MKKIVLRVVVAILAVLLIAVIAFGLFAGAIIKKSVNTVGPAALGVPVTLQDARFSPLRGHLRLSGLHVGNPKGFKTGSLFDADTIEVDVNVRSLFSNMIVIRRILVREPQITYERGLKTSNLGALLDQLGGGASAKPAPDASREKPTPKPQTESKPGKKVVIDELTISGGKVKLSVTAAMGLSAPIALSTVSMKNIGRESGTEGIGITDVVRIVLDTVLKSVVEAVGGVGGLAADGFKAIGGGAKQIGAGTVESLKSFGGEKAAEGIKAVGQGAVQVGGAAVDGVKNIGGGVGKAIGGLFGGDDSTNAPASATR